MVCAPKGLQNLAQGRMLSALGLAVNNDVP